MARIFLLYLCLQNSEFVRSLSCSSKKGTQKTSGYKYDNRKVRDWYDLIEFTLAVDRWLRLDSHPRQYFFVGEDELSNRGTEPLAQTRIRNYMNLFRRVVKRKKGTGLLLTKFHHLLHFVHYCRIHGKMSNFDGSRPEAHGKDLTKNPAMRTNNELAKL